MNDIALIHKLRGRGMCCAQVLVQMGLSSRGEDNPQFVEAVSGLCGGLHTREYACGSLLGAACVFAMFDKELAQSEMIPEILEWFEDTYEAVNCIDVLKGDTAKQPFICPQLIEDTWLQVKKILLSYGFELLEEFELDS